MGCLPTARSRTPMAGSGNGSAGPGCMSPRTASRGRSDCSEVAWALGGGGGVLGYPMAAQKAEPGSGLSQQFSRGGLYYSPTRGIHYVRSRMNTEYLRLGGVSGALGHPLDSTGLFKGGFGQRFANGWLYWSSATGFHTTGGVVASSYARSGVQTACSGTRSPRTGGAGRRGEPGVPERLADLVAAIRDRPDRPTDRPALLPEGGGAFGYPMGSTVTKSDGVLSSSSRA